MKKRVIRPLFLTAALSMVLSNGAFAYEGIDTLPDLSDYPTRVMIDGQYAAGPAPLLHNQEADLPLRVILEGADYTVSWDNHTRTVLAVSPSGTEYRMAADTGTVTKNNAVLCQDDRIGLSNGSLYVSEETLARWRASKWIGTRPPIRRWCSLIPPMITSMDMTWVKAP